ncbi:unnamed protein product, partial [Ectocarpus sp. 12 AP-2014]
GRQEDQRRAPAQEESQGQHGGQPRDCQNGRPPCQGVLEEGPACSFLSGCRDVRPRRADVKEVGNPRDSSRLLVHGHRPHPGGPGSVRLPRMQPARAFLRRHGARHRRYGAAEVYPGGYRTFGKRHQSGRAEGRGPGGGGAALHQVAGDALVRADHQGPLRERCIGEVPSHRSCQGQLLGGGQDQPHQEDAGVLQGPPGKIHHPGAPGEDARRPHRYHRHGLSLPRRSDVPVRGRAGRGRGGESSCGPGARGREGGRRRRGRRRREGRRGRATSRRHRRREGGRLRRWERGGGRGAGGCGGQVRRWKRWRWRRR